MKELLLPLLLAFTCSNLIFAQSSSDSVILRINGIYIDEVFDGGDEGVGGTIELALIHTQTEDIFQTVGLEIGYITSDAEDSDGGIEAETDADLIPVFVNYTISGYLGNSGLALEAGAGIGGIFVDTDLDVTVAGLGSASASDDDIVFGGQFFGRLGYVITDGAQLSVGVRYMLSADADLFGVEDELLNTVASDISLSFSF